MVAGIWSAQRLLEDPPPVTGALDATRFPAAREIDSFSLVDHTGAIFDNASLVGYWSFIFFGYTHCPDVCPTTLSVLNSVAHQLADAGNNIRYIFVSIDPERDTPEKMAGYVKYFNKNFVGVTGTPGGIQQLTSALGIMHMKAGTTDSGYLVDHSASVLLFDPDGRYHAVFSAPLSAATLSSDFRKMQQAYR